MNRMIVAIGGGELKTKETAEIDRFLCGQASLRAEGRRAVALFVGTASHDCMPYYNSFHKTYTGDYGLKTDVALVSAGVSDREKLEGKFTKADLIYVGGGDTVYMLKRWKETGVDLLIGEAYRRGAIVCGLSAGAICWFSEMYSDSASEDGDGAPYRFLPALGFLKGGACPHFEERREDFLSAVATGRHEDDFYCIGNRSALLFENENFSGSIGPGESFLYRAAAGLAKKL